MTRSRDDGRGLDGLEILLATMMLVTAMSVAAAVENSAGPDGWPLALGLGAAVLIATAGPGILIMGRLRDAQLGLKMTHANNILWEGPARTAAEFERLSLLTAATTEEMQNYKSATQDIAANISGIVSRLNQAVDGRKSALLHIVSQDGITEDRIIALQAQVNSLTCMLSDVARALAAVSRRVHALIDPESMTRSPADDEFLAAFFREG